MYSLYIQLERAIEDGFIASTDTVDELVIVDRDPVQLVDRVIQRMSHRNKETATADKTELQF